MQMEKSWEAVLQQFTANGTQDGIITVADASGFFTKQQVTLTSSTQPPLTLEVKIVTPTTIQVGQIDKGINSFSDVTAYLVADSAQIFQPQQQKRLIKPDEVLQAVYQKDPAVALRNLLVNKFGLPVDTVAGPDGRTRLQVDAQVTIEDISVALDALTPSNKPDPDNVLIAGSEDGTKGGVKRQARITSGGQIYTYDADAITQLQQIVAALNASLTKFSIGTEDGTESGVPHVFVNNVRQMVLASQDRKRDAFYLDIASKKDRRLDKFEYTSPTFPGVTLVRQFSWTLVGTEYVYENDEWSVV